MPYDDQRGRTGSFQQGLKIPTGQGGGGTNWGVPQAPSFLGGNEAGGFLSGGPAGGFTNFSQYLMANPEGAGQIDPAAATTPGQSGIDTAMNTAYGVHSYGGGGPPPPPPPPPPTGGGGPTPPPPALGTGPNGGPAGPGPGGPTGGGTPVSTGPGWSSGWSPGSGMLPGTGGGSPPPPPPPPTSTGGGSGDPFSKKYLR